MDYDDGDEEEQRPLTKADIRALFEEQDARHKEEIRLQEERINAKHKEEIRIQSDEQAARHKEEIRLQEERINAAHKEQIRALEEATDRRIKDLEQASASSPPSQDIANDSAGATQTNDENLPLTNNQGTSNTQLTPNRPRRGISAILSFLFFRRERNEESGSDHDNEAGDDNDRYEVLEEDTFSLMMLNKPFREIPCCHPTLLMILFMLGFSGFILLFFRVFGVFDVFGVVGVFFGVENPTLNWSLLAAFVVMMFGPLSCPWLLSIITFLLQLLLGLLITLDQTLVPWVTLGCYYYGTYCVPFHVPLGTSIGLTIAQYLAIFIALAMQYDIFSSFQTVGKLRNMDYVPWDEVIGQPGNRTWGLWICRILLPNIFKFIQATVTLFTIFILIIQTTRVVDLLKDFTALLIVSQTDNIIFHVIGFGYFGDNLQKKTEEVKAARWMILEGSREEGDTDEDEEEKPHCRCSCKMGNCIFFILAMAMIGGLTFFVAGQYTGKFLKMKYPECNVQYPFSIGNGICEDILPYNSAECGWDGGDCPEPSVVKENNNCVVSFPEKIGDGQCHFWPPYNTAECGWDGGDCPEPTNVEGFDNCRVSYPFLIGDGVCLFWAPYNTAECGWDGGDCREP